MPRLIAYACPVEGGTAGTSMSSDDPRLEPPGIEINGQDCTVRLQPMTFPARRVFARLLPEGATIYCDVGPPSLRFGRAIESTGNEAKTALLDELAMLLRHPDHCHWKQATVLASGAGQEPVRQIGPRVTPESPGGNARHRPVLPGARSSTVARLTAPEAVPGDLLALDWVFDGGNGPVHTTHAGGYMATPCLRGGRVVEVAGQAAEEDRRYLVEGHGGWAVCSASDHVPYAVGDWVYYSYVDPQCISGRWWDTYSLLDITLQTGGGHALPEPTPRPALTAGQPPQAVILPLLCGAYQAASPAFEAYPMPQVTPHPMGDLLDFCLRIALVIESDDQGRLSLEMPWGRVDQVPVHYHCPDATGTAGGQSAFQAQDAVLVVSTREQERVHAVIGFADKLPRPCKEYVVVATKLPETEARTFYIVWDVTAGTLAEDLPVSANPEDGMVDPASFPCERSVIAYWLDSRSRPVPPVDTMGNLVEAPRIGFMDTVDSRLDDTPHPGRFGADLDCTLHINCPEFASLELGGKCGECMEQRTQPNPYSGEDTSIFKKEVNASFDAQTQVQSVYEQHIWEAQHPFLQCQRQAEGPHPAYSLRCHWGSFQDVIQVSRHYKANKYIRFNSDQVDNQVYFEELVRDRIAFPGVPHRPEFTWLDLSYASRPVTDPDGILPKSWIWRDRDVTVGGFGVRSQRSWLFAYVCMARRWHIEPFTDPGAKIREPGFDVSIAAGAGSTQDAPVEASPFNLPTHAGLEAALQDLVEAAFAEGDFSNRTHSENLFSWEVRV